MQDSMKRADVEAAFTKIGAHAAIRNTPTWRAGNSWRDGGTTEGVYRVNVGRRHDGSKAEMFSLQIDPQVKLKVIDVQPKDRHLLLEVEPPVNSFRPERVPARFLCGHDERHWFVAAIPEKAEAITVEAAKDALQPLEVKEAVVKTKLPKHLRHSRRNKAFKRQGEWYFIPRRDVRSTVGMLLLNEPIQRGSSKAHICEHILRVGGERVHVHRTHAPNGIGMGQFLALSLKKRQASGWIDRFRGAAVYAKGTVHHPDHRTLVLHGWHQVVMNEESKAVAMRNVAFLD